MIAIRRVFLIILLVVLSSYTAMAQTNWVARFLDRYQPRAMPETENSASATPTQIGVVPLTTSDLVRLLLENNRDLTVVRGVPISSLYSTLSLYRVFEPNFHVIGSINHTETPSSNILAGAVSLIQLNNDFRVGVDQTLQTGTSYTADFVYNRASSNSVFFVFNPAYNGSIEYQITQHALRDFGRSANSHLIRIARNNQKISELDFELQITELVSQALQSYWDLVFSVGDIGVKQRSLDLATKTLHDNEIQVTVGSLAPIDLVQAEAEVATRYEDLVTAQYNNDQLQDDLKKTISNETDPGLGLGKLSLVDRVRRPGDEPILPLEQAIRFALENRREMKQADYDLANQDIGIQFAKNQKRPILDLTAGFTHAGLGGTATIRRGLGQDSEIVAVVPGGISDMFSQLFTFKYPAYNAGFTLQIPLSNGAAKAEYDRALNERELSEKRKAATAQRIALEVRNAYVQLDMNKARVTTAHTSRELAGRRLDAEQKKFELGTSTVRFVLEEQRNLAQAESDEIQALVNYTKSLVIYDKAIGNTLARNKIELEKQLPGQLASQK